MTTNDIAGRLGFNKRKEPAGEAVPQKANGQRMGVLASDAAVKYCQQAADYLEEVGSEIVTLAQSFAQDCRATAENLRQIGELEKARTSGFYATIGDALRTIQSTRKTFEHPFELKQTAEVQVVTAAVAAVGAALATVVEGEAK